MTGATLAFLLGLAAAAYTRFVRWSPRWVALIGCLAPFACLGAAWLPAGFWDLAVEGSLFAVGLWTGLASRPTRTLVVVAGLLLIGLVGLEAFARLALRPPARIDARNPDAQWVPLAEASRDEIAGRLDPRLGPAFSPWFTSNGSPDLQPVLAHVGDSMIAGSGVQREETMTAELARLFPQVVEANLGVVRTSTDLQFLWLTRWLKTASHPPFMVVHHFYVLNDLVELDCDRNVCAGAGPLEYTADGPVPCRSPHWNYSVSDLVELSPPPELVREAAHISVAARHALVGFGRISESLTRCLGVDGADGPAPPDEAVKWEHVEQILRAERDALKSSGIALAAAVIPDRRSLESPRPDETYGRRVGLRAVEILNRLQIRVLDPWPALRGAVDRDGAAKYFLPADIHFSPEGHRLYARWLLDQLRTDLSHARVIAR